MTIATLQFNPITLIKLLIKHTYLYTAKYSPPRCTLHTLNLQEKRCSFLLVVLLLYPSLVGDQPGILCVLVVIDLDFIVIVILR